MSVFRRTNGLTGENTSTEILSYLLDPLNTGLVGSSFVAFQKLFFNRLLGRPLDSQSLQVEIHTQSGFLKDRPDAALVADDALIVIENKLGSYLSSNDQLLRYAGMFDRLTEFRKVFPLLQPDRIKAKVLVFLAPSRALELGVHTTEEQLSDETFPAYCKERGIRFLPLAWEDLLTDLDRSNALQNELYLYVEEYIDRELTMKELELLRNMNVPSALEKLYSLVAQIQGHVQTKGFQPSRIGQSYLFYGFTTELGSASLWFGYSQPTWLRYETPVIAQLRESSLKCEKGPVLDCIRDTGFKQDAELEYVLPFGLDDVANWSNKLVSVLEAIRGAAGAQ